MDGVLRFTFEEEVELRTLVEQAWELKQHSSPYLQDAYEAIVAWRDRLFLVRYERLAERRADEARVRDRRHDELAQLLRDTDPSRIGEPARAA